MYTGTRIICHMHTAIILDDLGQCYYVDSSVLRYGGFKALV